MTPSPEKKLSRRHVEFLAIGGTIGAGLFLGSGTGIHRAGPSLIIAYILAGAVVFIIAKCLAEMALEDPGRGTFVDYVRHYLGETTAFVNGWCYWFGSVLAAMAELTAVGALSHAWAPLVPQWLPTFAALLCLYVINKIHVRAFGEVEFWMALLKIMALAAFVGLGTVMLLAPEQVRPPAATFSNLWTRGGVFPTGLRGFLEVLPLALISFGGVELIGLAAAETRDPARTLPRAVNGLILRLFMFYVGSMIIVMSIVPWTEISSSASPFVLVLQRLGIPAVATVMNVLLISVLTSSCNSLLFGNARVLSSLAVNASAPPSLGVLNARGVPTRAAGVSTVAISVTILLNYFIPAQAFGLLLSAAVVQLMIIWAIFVLAHLQFRSRSSANGTAAARSALPIGCSYGALAIVATVIVILACDPQFRSALVFSLTFIAVLAVVSHSRFRQARLLTSD